MSHDRPSPGPWYTDLEHEHLMVFGSDKIAVADCAPYNASPPQAVCEANARLIAAAPELLMALKRAAIDLSEKLEASGELADSVTLAHVHAVIAKAEGRS